MIRSSVAGLASLALVACAHAVTVTPVGPASGARALDCPLELTGMDPHPVAPPGMDLLGYVKLSHEFGRSPTDPSLLETLKPEACRLGGQSVTIQMSKGTEDSFSRGSSITYAVFGKRTTPATPSNTPAPPQPLRF